MLCIYVAAALSGPHLLLFFPWLTHLPRQPQISPLQLLHDSLHDSPFFRTHLKLYSQACLPWTST